MAETASTPELLPLRRPGVKVDRSEAEPALVSGSDGRRFVLNETALVLWELCDGATSPEEMISAICGLFATDRSQVAGDVDRALDRFGRRGLIEWRTPAG